MAALRCVRPKVRRRGQDHVVDFGMGEQLFVGVETDEALILRDVETELCQVAMASLEPLFE